MCIVVPIIILNKSWVSLRIKVNGGWWKISLRLRLCVVGMRAYRGAPATDAAAVLAAVVVAVVVAAAVVEPTTVGVVGCCRCCLRNLPTDSR